MASCNDLYLGDDYGDSGGQSGSGVGCRNAGEGVPSTGGADTDAGSDRCDASEEGMK